MTMMMHRSVLIHIEFKVRLVPFSMFMPSSNWILFGFFCFMFVFVMLSCVFLAATVLPAKSDRDVMFYSQNIRDLESIDYLCINPILRIGLIHK